MLTIRLIGRITLTVQVIVLVNPIMVEQIVQHQINVQDTVIGLTVAAIAHATVDMVELIAHNQHPHYVPDMVIGKIVLTVLVIVLLVIVVGVEKIARNKILVQDMERGIIVLMVPAIVLVTVVGVEKIVLNLW